MKNSLSVVGDVNKSSSSCTPDNYSWIVKTISSLLSKYLLHYIEFKGSATIYFEQDQDTTPGMLWG